MKVVTRFFSISMAVLLAVCIGLQNQPVRALESVPPAQHVLPVISGNAGVPGATLSYTDGTPQTATADGAGNYSFSVTSGFAGTVTPSKTGYAVVFTPASIDYSAAPVTTDQTNQNYVPDTSWWTVAGAAGVAGVTLSYNDGSPESVVANGSGNYSLLVPDNFAGTITPSMTGYTFSPTSIDYSSTPVTAGLTGQDYIATAITYSISGNAGVAGATLSYTDGSPQTATADGNGDYTFTVSYNWAGTVTPSYTGYTFSPASIDYSSTPVLGDLTSQDYTATAITYSISGNAGIAGATLSYTDGTPQTATADGSGNYTFTVSYNWAGTVTPSYTGYSFSPASIDYSSTPVLANLTNQNYTAAAITYSISGNVGVAGATLSYTDGTPKTAVANGSGNYAFTVSYNWSGTVTPSYAGTATNTYTFSPVYKSYVNVLANQSVQNYTATPHTAIAVLSAPGGTINDPTPTYKWSRIPAATQYEYRLFKGTSLIYVKTISSAACPVGPCTNTPAKVLTDGTYKWKLRVLAGGVWRAYSAYKTFSLLTVPAPKLPSGSISDTTPTYTWARITGATQYQIQLYNGASLVYSNTVSASCSGTTCSNTPTTILPISTAYKWHVRAKVSGGIWRPFSAYKSFSIIAVPLLNGNFESGPTVWSQYSLHGWPIIRTTFAGGLKPHSGIYGVWLGGDYNDISYVQQYVYVSPSAPYLSYWRWIASADACNYDFGGVLVNNTVVQWYTLCYPINTGGWVRSSVNLSAYAGQNVYVQIRVETDNILNSNLFIDDVSFQATAASVQSAPIGNPNFDAATMQEQEGPQGELPEGLMPTRIWLPLTRSK